MILSSRREVYHGIEADTPLSAKWTALFRSRRGTLDYLILTHYDYDHISGVAELLERVREHRSLRAAAASMEMAYSKAWRIIHEAEEGFGFRLLDSTIGGRHGGGASLTPEAEQLLADYRRFEADIFAYSQARFQEIFPQSKP